MRLLLKRYAKICQHKILEIKMNHPKHERTLVIIKPDGIQRSLVGEIVKRYEQIG